MMPSDVSQLAQCDENVVWDDKSRTALDPKLERYGFDMNILYINITVTVL